MNYVNWKRNPFSKLNNGGCFSQIRFIFTGRNEVVAKVIVLHLSVILFTGGACLRQTPQVRHHPPQFRHPPGADITPRSDTHISGLSTPPSGEANSGIWSTSGRYASYWNAFLFFFQNSQSCHYYTTSTNVNIIRNSFQVNKYLQYFKFVKGTWN